LIKRTLVARSRIAARRSRSNGHGGIMNQTLLRSWWLLALRGAIAVLFGLAAVLWPAMTLITLAALFSAFTLLAGALWMFGAISHRALDRRWWVLLLLGAFSVGAGTLAALDPQLTIVALVLLMGANALVTGVLDIVIALRQHQQLRGEWLLVLSGIISVIFGLIVLMFPAGAGALALAWLTGAYAMLTGFLLLALAWQARHWSRSNGGRGGDPAGAR
jgi:uncharacterized membrane protein HdeD (DUF308 family)